MSRTLHDVELSVRGHGDGTGHGRAIDPDDRLALVERFLCSPGEAIIVMRLKRDDRLWSEWQADPTVNDFVQIGTLGTRAAAQHVRGNALTGQWIIGATTSSDPAGPARGDEPVPYDYDADRTFPEEHVTSLGTVRALAVEYALYGQWEPAPTWRRMDHMVG